MWYALSLRPRQSHLNAALVAHAYAHPAQISVASGVAYLLLPRLRVSVLSVRLIELRLHSVFLCHFQVVSGGLRLTRPYHLPTHPTLPKPLPTTVRFFMIAPTSLSRPLGTHFTLPSGIATLALQCSRTQACKFTFADASSRSYYALSVRIRSFEARLFYYRYARYLI